MSRRNWIPFLRIGIGAAVVFFLYLYIRATPWQETIGTVKQVGVGFCWVLLTSFTAYSLATAGWYYCLGKSRKYVPVGQLFLIRHIGETVGLFNPASVLGGDLMKVSMLSPLMPDRTVVISSVYLSRFLMIISQLLLFLMALCWMLLTLPLATAMIPEAIQIVLVSVICLLLVAGLVMLFARLGTESAPLVTTRARQPWQKFQAFRRQAVVRLLEDPHSFFLAFLFFMLHWLVGSVEVGILLCCLGVNVPLMYGLFMDMGVIIIKSAGAFIPGQLGVEEMGNKIILTILGIGNPAIWLSISIARRARQLFWAFIGALLYIILLKRNLRPLLNNR